MVSHSELTSLLLKYDGPTPASSLVTPACRAPTELSDAHLVRADCFSVLRVPDSPARQTLNVCGRSSLRVLRGEPLTFLAVTQRRLSFAGSHSFPHPLLGRHAPTVPPFR